MSETFKLVAVGLGMLILGIFFFTKRKSWSKQLAQQFLQYKWTEWFNSNYSEEFFRLHYAFGGVFCSLAGITLIVKAIADVQQGIWNDIRDIITILLLVTGFGGGLIFIIYAHLKFSRIWKWNRK
jgi:hypothetical protein